ncbi:Protein TPX2 [Linum perenne]
MFTVCEAREPAGTAVPSCLRTADCSIEAISLGFFCFLPSSSIASFTGGEIEVVWIDGDLRRLILAASAALITVEEMEGGMEEEMEVDLLFYEAREVDPDYEFDAPMFFDFVREETLAEAIIAQRWFDSATSYPPSPFVAKLELREEILLKNINTSPKTKDVEYVTTSLDDDDGGGDLGPGRAATTVGDGHKGFIFYNYLKGDKLKAKTKPNSRGGSTLMRPTASLLAKQTQASRVGGSRFQLLTDQKEKSVHNSSMVEGQAAKRQKLEGGNLRKVGDGKPQTDFLHKAPAKVAFLIQQAIINHNLTDKTSFHVKLRLTIPREPDFETGYRAHRTRPVNNTTELEHTTVSVRRFKARPLNRKILEAPSLPIPKRSIPRMPEFQEFHLMTSERAKQHTSTVSSSSLHCNNSNQGNAVSVAETGKRESRRPSTFTARKQDVQSTAHVFKARPLDKKILSSKGDIGVFRNSKRQTTVPMEFNLHTDRRTHNPPVDLFSKLSLTSEIQPSAQPQAQFSRPNSVAKEGSKENQVNPLPTDRKSLHVPRGRPSGFGGKQTHTGSNGCNSEVGNQYSLRYAAARRKELGHPVRVAETT